MEHVYSVQVCGKPPPYLGTIVGDVFHNLMSALDSIIYELSAPSVPTLTEGQRRSIGFPISLTEQKYDGSPAKYASKAAQTEIERSQPYCGDVPELDPLWTIREFNRIDKHRYVHVVPALSMGSQWIDPGIPHGERTHPIGPFVDGAELARFTFSDPQPEVDMQFRPMFDVTLPDRRFPAGSELRECIEHVRTTIISRFERLVP